MIKGNYSNITRYCDSDSSTPINASYHKHQHFTPYLTDDSSADLTPLCSSVNRGSTRGWIDTRRPRAAAAFRRTVRLGSFNAFTNVVCNCGRNGRSIAPHYGGGGGGIEKQIRYSYYVLSKDHASSQNPKLRHYTKRLFGNTVWCPMDQTPLMKTGAPEPDVPQTNKHTTCILTK